MEISLLILLSILTGFASGFLSRDIEIERKIIYLFLCFYIPFLAARIILFLAAGIVSGILGLVLFNIYLLAIVLGRKL